MDAPPRAFISYARSDGEAFASALRRRLQTEHPSLALWQDRAEMEGGSGWWKQIAEALDQVEVLIMVMTPAVIASDEEYEELQVVGAIDEGPVEWAEQILRLERTRALLLS